MFCQSRYVRVGHKKKLTWGSDNQFSTACNQPSIVMSSEKRILITYKNPAGGGVAIGGQVVDSTRVNFGTPAYFHSFALDQPKLVRLKDNLAAIAYLDSANKNQPHILLVDIKASEPSFKSKLIVERSDEGATFIALSVANDSKILITYRPKDGDNPSAKVAIAEILESGYLAIGHPTTVQLSGPAQQAFQPVYAAAIDVHRALILYRTSDGQGYFVDGDIIGRTLYLGRRQKIIPTSDTALPSMHGLVFGKKWLISYAEGLLGKIKFVSQWGGARVLGIAATGVTGTSGSIDVIVEGLVDSFAKSSSFSSGGVVFATNDGKVSAEYGVGLLIGRALADNTLLVENLAKQNDVMQARSTAVGGQILASTRRRATTNIGRGSWIFWNVVDYETKDAFKTEVNHRDIHFLKQGVYYLSIKFNVVGSADNCNWLYLYKNGAHYQTAKDHSGGHWWNTLRFSNLVRMKPNDNLRLKAYWCHSSNMHAHGMQGSTHNHFTANQIDADWDSCTGGGCS